MFSSKSLPIVLPIRRDSKYSNRSKKCSLPFAPASSVCQSATMFLRKFQETPRTYPQVPIKIDMSRENESCLQTLALRFSEGSTAKIYSSSHHGSVEKGCISETIVSGHFPLNPGLREKEKNPLIFNIDT